MNDTLEEIEVFSPFGGTLIEELVPGDTTGMRIAENSVSAATGIDRTMYSYVPASGVPDAKQCQVLMVLRNEGSKESAEALLDSLDLRNLAEKKHFILLFPNPFNGAWNINLNQGKDNDLDYLVRCFACLPKSKGKAAGFNGMIFCLATTPETSALITNLFTLRPIECAAAMLGPFPSDYQIPIDAVKAPQVAWVYGGNKQMNDYLAKANAPLEERPSDDNVICHNNQENQNIRWFTTDRQINTDMVKDAWERMFSEARRWRNDTYGTYQKRTNFSERGFEAHIKEVLGDNDGLAHTWYEYVPERLRNSKEKAPLVFYFHGGGCIPLYGAEQSGWHDLADRDGFIVCYPKASAMKAWNAWDDKDSPSDFAFILKLLEYLEEKYSIDESRIYISGFSMGSMFSNALACCYPELFAGAAPCNAHHAGYLSNRASMHKMGPQREFTEEEKKAPSPVKLLADRKKKENDLRIPVFQCTGLLDGLGPNGGWPTKAMDSGWSLTINYWRAFNHMPDVSLELSDEYPTGLKADENRYECDDQRFLHQIWYTEDTHQPLYHLLAAKRMPHALDLREIELAWNFLKHYSRGTDGSLIYEEQ